LQASSILVLDKPTHVLSVVLPETLYVQVREQAEKCGLPRTAWIRTTLIAALKEEVVS